jgi:hypothetical protein
MTDSPVANWRRRSSRCPPGEGRGDARSRCSHRCTAVHFIVHTGPTGTLLGIVGAPET